MALISLLQRSLIKQCRGPRQRFVPLITQFGSPNNIRHLTYLQCFKNLTPRKPCVSICIPKDCIKITVPKTIHTSPSHRAIPPIIWVALRPLLNVFVIIFGKLFKRWWKKQSPESKAEFWNKVRKNKTNILAVSGLLVFLGGMYYYTHLEYAPITNRRRFMMLRNKDMEDITNHAVELIKELHEDKILRVNHPSYAKVERVMKRLISANRDTLKQQDISKLRIHVINSPERNAVVLPNCTVFIYNGIFDLCHNDDQLAAILAHELSHAVLNHQAEALSKDQVLDTLMLIVLLFVWATFPDAAAFLWQLVSLSMSQLLIKLPFSREMELEADAVGLQLMAKACFDVRETASVWGKLSYLEEIGVNDQPPEIVSTHPASKKRQDRLEGLIPGAIDLRGQCNCARLPSSDPRTALELWKRGVDASLIQQRAKQMPTLIITF